MTAGLWWRLGALTVSLLAVLTSADVDTPTSSAQAPYNSFTSDSTLQMGVTVFALWRDWERLDELLDRARDSQSPWLRVDAGWCSLEERGPEVISTWYQDRMDAVVAGAHRRDLRLLITLSCPPSWTGATIAHPYPSDPNQFERIARHLADRYRGRVAAWEIGNEPDCVGGCPAGSAEDYVAFLKAGYRGVKAVDGKTTVVSAGISGNNAYWIGRMYDAGAQGYFDALAVHPYQDPPDAPPGAPSKGYVYRLTSVTAVRDQMVRHGDSDKPIWFTEFGWSTALVGERRGVDEVTQAQYLDDAVRHIARTYPYVTNAFWFTLRDRDDWTDYENSFGLLRVDGSAKSAFRAMQGVNKWLESNDRQ